MKNVKKLLALLLALVMLFALCACGGDKTGDEKDTKTSSSSAKKEKKDALAGKWVDEEEGVILTLKDGGTGSVGMDGVTIDLEWEATKSELTWTMTFMGETEEQTFEYELDGDVLTLIDENGDETVLVKNGTSSNKGSSAVVDDELTDDTLQGDWDVTMNIGALMATGLMGDMSEVTDIIDPEALEGVVMEMGATFDDGEATLHSMDMIGLYDDLMDAIMDWLSEGDNIYEFLAAVDGTMTADEYKAELKAQGVSKSMLLATMESELPSAEDAGIEEMDEIVMSYELDDDTLYFEGENGEEEIWVFTYEDETIYVVEAEVDGEIVVLDEGDFVMEKN